MAVPLWWPLYFDEAPYDERDRRSELTEALLAFFSADDAGFNLLAAVRARVHAPATCLMRGPGAHDTEARSALGRWMQMSCDPGAGYSLPLDYARLREVAPIPDLFAALDLAPAEALACLAAAAHGAALLSQRGVAELPALQPPFAESRVRVLLHNHAASRQRFRAISSRTVGALRPPASCLLHAFFAAFFTPATSASTRAM